MYEMKPNFFSSSNKSAFTLEGDSFWKYTANTNSVKVFGSVVLYKNYSSLSTFYVTLAVKF